MYKVWNITIFFEATVTFWSYWINYEPLADAFIIFWVLLIVDIKIMVTITKLTTVNQKSKSI